MNTLLAFTGLAIVASARVISAGTEVALVAGTTAPATQAVGAISAPAPDPTRSTDAIAGIPNPEHIRLLALKDVQWTGDERVKRATLFGDPSKPGIYGILYKWEPGHYSDPHFHSSDRFAFVISGRWWNSSNDVKDVAGAYPVPAGTFVQHVAGKTHWDGAKDEPAILLMVGMGPVDTVRVLPKRPLQAAPQQ